MQSMEYAFKHFVAQVGITIICSIYQIWSYDTMFSQWHRILKIGKQAVKYHNLSRYLVVCRALCIVGDISAIKECDRVVLIEIISTNNNDNALKHHFIQCNV